jgi:3-hydroxyacyl-[acyl-carrier-protein] dehydratase
MSESNIGPKNMQEILKVAPHRYPFLLVDRVLESDGKNIVGLKNVTYNEPFFQGHFPERPVFPGVLMLEAIAQLGGFVILSQPEHLGKLAFFAAADNVKWRRQVTPGDQMLITVEVLKEKRGIVVTQGKITVDGELACEATVKFVISEERSQTR